MIEHILIFPSEDDLPLGFITWARNKHEGVSIQLQFLETHTNVIIKSDCLTPFNDCVFYMGQWFSKILESIPDERVIKAVDVPFVNMLPNGDPRFTDEKGGQEYATPVVIDNKPETLGEKEIFNPGKRKRLSYAEALAPTTRIQDPAEAETYLNDYIDFVAAGDSNNPESVISRKQAEFICKNNIYTYSQRCSLEIKKRIEKLFHCSNEELLKLQL